MTSFSKTPTTWTEAETIERGPSPKRGKDRPLGHQTRLVRIDDDRFAVRHVDTNVITFLRDGSLILDAEVVSYTTMKRLRAFTPESVHVIAMHVRTENPYYDVFTPDGVVKVYQGEWIRLTESEMRSAAPVLATRIPGQAAETKRWS